MRYTLGIDLGGTSAKLAVVNHRKKIVAETAVRTSGRPAPALLARFIAKAAKPLMWRKPIKQVGVGVAGDIDFNRGIIRVSPNLGWKKVPLRTIFQRTFHKKVVVDNDANAAAWGIYNTQTPASVKNIIVATLGTGVGGGIIINGQVHRGATGTAGEIGHLTMVRNGRSCNCGNKGCLETYAGGWYITREVKKQLKMGQRSQLQTLYRKDSKNISPFTIAKAAQRGDRFARSVWKQAGEMLGTALGNLIYTLNPQMIFLTGGVSQAGTLILTPLRQVLKSRAFKVPIGAAKLKIARDAPHVGVIGASLL